MALQFHLVLFFYFLFVLLYRRNETKQNAITLEESPCSAQLTSLFTDNSLPINLIRENLWESINEALGEIYPRQIKYLQLGKL